MAPETLLLDMNRITKTYPGVRALDAVSFGLRRGEVHALVGENGAGKSTLMKILMGIERKDEGEILKNGKTLNIRDAQEATANGISSVFQELSQIPDLTIGENIFLGKAKGLSQFHLNRRRIYADTRDVLREYRVDLDPRALISTLPIAKRQLAEIVKAVVAKPEILILDEPTSSLTEDEAENLFSIVRAFKERGIGVIYISHRMSELKKIADRVTVLHDGRLVGTRQMDQVSMHDIVAMMLGRDVDLYESNSTSTGEAPKTEKVLEVRNLCRRGSFQDISFDLYKGEILGIAGLVGSGRSELMNIIFGVDGRDSGDILVDGRKRSIACVRDALESGIAMIPESRHQQGLVLIHSVAENLVLPVVKRFQRWGLLRGKLVLEFAERMIGEYRIRTDSPHKTVRYLSGGNQQKIVIAKWLATKPRILIVDELTAGIDVHSKTEIHRLIRSLTKEGLSVIMISSEMPEIIAYSDRVMVMNDNRILGIIDRPDQGKIMYMIMEDKNRIRGEEGRHV